MERRGTRTMYDYYVRVRRYDYVQEYLEASAQVRGTFVPSPQTLIPNQTIEILHTLANL